VIDRWSLLTDTLRLLLGNPRELSDRSERTKQWWIDVLSERPVAEYMRRALESIEAID